MPGVSAVHCGGSRRSRLMFLARLVISTCNGGYTISDRIARTALYRTAFHDVTRGDNTVEFPPQARS